MSGLARNVRTTPVKKPTRFSTKKYSVVALYRTTESILLQNYKILKNIDKKLFQQHKMYALGGKRPRIKK